MIILIEDVIYVWKSSKVHRQIFYAMSVVNLQEDVMYVEEFIKNLKPLNNKQLAIAQEIEIKCGEFISIGIQLEERQYCYYEDKSQNISSISKMPDGLYEWIEEQSY